MAKIHNNPNAKEPRMPLVLPDYVINYWTAGEVVS